MKSVHTMLELLKKQRHGIGRDLAHRATGRAAAETMDRLIARIEIFTDRFPADTPMTASFVENDMGEGLNLIRLYADVSKKLADLLAESETVIYQRQQPLTAFISRIESEGYRVDTETFTTVTAEPSLELLDDQDDQAAVRAAAELIARQQQAALYQQRLQRMHDAVDRIESGYADQIRELVIPGL